VACVVLITHRISELTGVAIGRTVLQDGKDVGTLEGDEIVEKRLLELMSSKIEPWCTRIVPATNAFWVATATWKKDLRVSGLKLSIQAQPSTGLSASAEIVGLVRLEGQGSQDYFGRWRAIDRPVSGRY